jgi:hypothetical protein
MKGYFLFEAVKPQPFAQADCFLQSCKARSFFDTLLLLSLREKSESIEQVLVVSVRL